MPHDCCTADLDATGVFSLLMTNPPASFEFNPQIVKGPHINLPSAIENGEQL